MESGICICNGIAKKGYYQFVVIGTLNLYLIFLIMLRHQNLTKHFKNQLDIQII